MHQKQKIQLSLRIDNKTTGERKQTRLYLHLMLYVDMSAHMPQTYLKKTTSVEHLPMKICMTLNLRVFFNQLLTKCLFSFIAPTEILSGFI